MTFKYELRENNQEFPITIVKNNLTKTFIPHHWHESVEICYLEKGWIEEVYVDGQRFSLEAGDFIVINSGEIHSYFFQYNQSIEGATIFIPLEFLNNNFSTEFAFLFDCCSMKSISLERKTHYDQLRQVLTTIFETYTPDNLTELKIIRLKSLSYELIYLLLHHFRIEGRKRQTTQAQKQIERLGEIVQFIKQNIYQGLSLDEIANNCNLSKQYLSRFFHQNMGMTIFQYIQLMRLESGYRDLVNTSHTISQIALDSGFPNEKSFTKLFKSVYQMTPNQYRIHHVKK